MNEVEVTVAAADRRSGSEHEESVVDYRPWCEVCGFVDEGTPSFTYHPERYLSGELHIPGTDYYDGRDGSIEDDEA